MPFEVFFDVAGAIKRRIEALLRAEDPAAPLGMMISRTGCEPMALTSPGVR